MRHVLLAQLAQQEGLNRQNVGFRGRTGRSVPVFPNEDAAKCREKLTPICRSWKHVERLPPALRDERWWRSRNVLVTVSGDD
jgi:hypothetical protein